MEPEFGEEEEMDMHSHPDYEEVMRSLSRRMAKMEKSQRGYREEASNDPLPPVEDTLKVEPKAAESEEDARTKNATVGERLRRLERALRKREQAEEEKEEEKPKSERLRRKLERVKKLREQAEDEEKKLEEQLDEEKEKELEEQLEEDELKEELEKPVVAPEVAAEKEPEQLKEKLSRRASTLGNVRVKESLNSAIKKFYRGGC